MKEGALVPTGVTVRLLRAAMLASPASRFLVDGFPRAVEQARRPSCLWLPNIAVHHGYHSIRRWWRSAFLWGGVQGLGMECEVLVRVFGGCSV